MESVSTKYCQSCNCPIFASITSNPMVCIRCQKQCAHLAMIPLFQKTNRGELTMCPDCKAQIVLIDCPYTDCKKTFFAKKGYRMGEVCRCIKCAGRFRQVICLCGQKINAESNGIQKAVQGNTLVICNSCQTKFYFSTCNNCYHVNYSTHPIAQGEVVKCAKCISTYVLLICPQCNKSVSTGSFEAGRQYSCGSCLAKFDYTTCPACLQSNYSLHAINNSNFKVCYSYLCRNTYVHIVCKKCNGSLYMDKVTKGCEYNEKCRRCKQTNNIVYCMFCNVLHINEDKCPIVQRQKNIKNLFSVPSKQGNKALSELQKLAVDEKPDLSCKICMINSSKYANQSCGHLCVCEQCYNVLQIKSQTKDVCIMCRKKGQYIKIYTS